jgi:hypothetical protein
MEEPETSVKNRSPMTVIENGGRTEKSKKEKRGETVIRGAQKSA